MRHRCWVYLWPWARDEKRLVVEWRKCWAIFRAHLGQRNCLWRWPTSSSLHHLRLCSQLWRPAGNICVPLMKLGANVRKCTDTRRGQGIRGKRRGDEEMKGRRKKKIRPLNRMPGDSTLSSVHHDNPFTVWSASRNATSDLFPSFFPSIFSPSAATSSSSVSLRLTVSHGLISQTLKGR